MGRIFLISLGAAAIVCLLALTGITVQLGAHPRWGFDVALYGAIPGILLALGLSRLATAGIYFATLDLLIAGAIAWWGKRAFVASSGDNSFAGSLWFFGWIAICACAVAVLTLAVQRLRGAAD